MGQKERILKYLKCGKSLTGMEALVMFGTMKLAKRISELRQEGHDIMHQMINRNNKWIARYFIMTEDK